MKRKRILLLAVELILICILVGCECCECRELEPTNRKRLNLLKPGMTKAQVLRIMGRPYERAAYSNSEWLVYKTGSDREWVGHSYGGDWIDKPENEWLTPLLFLDGKLVGKDRNYWNKYKFRALK